MSRDFRTTSTDPSLTYSKAPNIIKKTTGFAEHFETTAKQKDFTSLEKDKENVFSNDTEASGSVVKELKSYYEKYSISRTVRATANGTKNTTSTGTINKRKISESSREVEKDKNYVAKKRPGIRDEEAFTKSRFKIYSDEFSTADERAPTVEKTGRKLERKLEYVAADKYESHPRIPIVDKRLEKVIFPVLHENVQARVTPIDVPPVPSTLKKVKVVHRNRLSTKSEKVESTSAIVTRDPKYELPYGDSFIEYELKKEISVSKLSRNFRRQNITIEQRKIILKFLTRLQSHLFLPSCFLYQTVKLFDAVLDAKIVDVKDMQLIALTTMWIALKREHIAYNIPTAQKMLSFAKDLYEGKVDMLLKCEIDILQTLNFNIVFPDPFSIMCYDITKCLRSQFMNSEEIHRAYCCGCYMIDISLFDEEMMKISVGLLAAAAAEAALYFTMEQVDDTVEPSWHLWRAYHTAKRYSDGEIATVRTMLIRKIFASLRRHSDGEIVFKKYLRSRYGRISHFLGIKVKSYLHEE